MWLLDKLRMIFNKILGNTCFRLNVTCFIDNNVNESDCHHPVIMHSENINCSVYIFI